MKVKKQKEEEKFSFFHQTIMCNTLCTSWENTMVDKSINFLKLKQIAT